MTTWTVPSLSATALEAMRQVFGQLESSTRLSEEQKQEIYSHCLSYYKQAQLDKAQTLLALLRIYAPMDYRFILLHGLCLKQ
jgi:hypothetical protein